MCVPSSQQQHFTNFFDDEFFLTSWSWPTKSRCLPKNANLSFLYLAYCEMFTTYVLRYNNIPILFLLQIKYWSFGRNFILNRHYFKAGFNVKFVKSQDQITERCFKSPSLRINYGLRAISGFKPKITVSCFFVEMFEIFSFLYLSFNRTRYIN